MLVLQGCGKLLQLLRDNAVAGAAFCKFLAQEAVSGGAQGVHVHLLASWSCLLARYLVECQIGACSKNRVAGSRSPSTEVNAKRMRPNEPSNMLAMGGVESPDDWTGLVAGFRELVVPLQQVSLQANASGSVKAVDPMGKIQHRKSKGKVYRTNHEMRETFLNALPADVLVSLFEKAPSIKVHSRC